MLWGTNTDTNKALKQPIPLTMLENAMKWFLCVMCIALLSGCGSGSDATEGEWKPSGDGKTIVNTKTGELRYTSSGKSVDEVNAEKKQVAAQQAKRFAARSEQETALFAERASQQKAEQKQVHEHNSRIYFRLKKFVVDHPMISGTGVGEISQYEWDLYTTPFRTNRMLNPVDQKFLLDFLGKAVRLEQYKDDQSFHEAIENLKRWEFGDRLRTLLDEFNDINGTDFKIE